MSIVLDARGVFLSRDLFDDPEGLVSHTPLARLARVSPGQILLTHSFETPIDDATQFVVEGTMAARGGAGGANVTGTIRHQFSPHLWIQVGTGWSMVLCKLETTDPGSVARRF